MILLNHLSRRVLEVIKYARWWPWLQRKKIFGELYVMFLYGSLSQLVGHKGLQNWKGIKMLSIPKLGEHFLNVSSVRFFILSQVHRVISHPPQRSPMLFCLKTKQNTSGSRSPLHAPTCFKESGVSRDSKTVTRRSSGWYHLRGVFAAAGVLTRSGLPAIKSRIKHLYWRVSSQRQTVWGNVSKTKTMTASLKL